MNNIRTICGKVFRILHYLSEKKTFRISFIFFFLYLSYTNICFGQTPGMVIKPALAPDRAVLDPDEDGYVSQKTNSLQLCFATPPSNSVSRNEFHYLYIQEVGSVFDLLRRPNGSIPELIGIDTDGKIGFTQTKANPKAVTGIPGYQAESVNENFLNVSTFNEKGIVFLFAQLCAQGAQLTPLLIPLYKIGKSIFNYSNLSF